MKKTQWEIWYAHIKLAFYLTDCLTGNDILVLGLLLWTNYRLSHTVLYFRCAVCNLRNNFIMIKVHSFLLIFLHQIETASRFSISHKFYHLIDWVWLHFNEKIVHVDVDNRVYTKIFRIILFQRMHVNLQSILLNAIYFQLLFTNKTGIDGHCQIYQRYWLHS